MSKQNLILQEIFHDFANPLTAIRNAVYVAHNSSNLNLDIIDKSSQELSILLKIYSYFFNDDSSLDMDNVRALIIDFGTYYNCTINLSGIKDSELYILVRILFILIHTCKNQKIHVDISVNENEIILKIYGLSEVDRINRILQRQNRDSRMIAYILQRLKILYNAEYRAVTLDENSCMLYITLGAVH